jgi:hypothetical protein
MDGSLLVEAISGGMVGAVLDARDVHITMAVPMMEYILAWV